jgi:hypothetical protein
MHGPDPVVLVGCGMAFTLLGPDAINQTHGGDDRAHCCAATAPCSTPNSLATATLLCCNCSVQQDELLCSTPNNQQPCYSHAAVLQLLRAAEDDGLLCSTPCHSPVALAKPPPLRNGSMHAGLCSSFRRQRGRRLFYCFPGFHASCLFYFRGFDGCMRLVYFSCCWL